VLYHFSPSLLPGGFLGVDVFFVLSGFLISSLILREGASRGTFSLSNFWIRRARRLMPALLLLLAAVGGYAAWFASPDELVRLRNHGLATLGYFANWRYISDGTSYTDLVSGMSPLRHTWSLAIEEQFYVVFPMVVFAVLFLVRGRIQSGRRVLGTLSVLGIIGSSALMLALFEPGKDPSRVYYGTDTRIHSLLVGVLLGVVTMGALATGERAGRIARGLGALGALAVIATFFVVRETDAWLYRGGLLAFAVVVAAVIFAARSSPAVRSVLESRGLVALGVISYGVYLWHWPVFVVVDEYATGLDGVALFFVRCSLTLAISIASFFLLEQPIRRGAIGRRLGRASATVAVASVTVVAIVLVSATAPSTELTAVVKQRLPTLQAPSAPMRVVLLGDSVAYTVAGGKIDQWPEFDPWRPSLSPFDPQRVSLSAVTKPACSYLPGLVAVPDEFASLGNARLDQFCGDWRADLDQELSAAPTQFLVVLLVNDLKDRKVNGRRVNLGSPEHDAMLRDLFDELRTAAVGKGADLVLLVPPPRRGPSLVSEDKGGFREQRFADLARDYAAGTSDVHVLDLGPQICPRGNCDEPRGGFDLAWRYDGAHYSPQGAAWVANWLTLRLDEIRQSELEAPNNA
jgi:peptidoglycan/LPS O-acetylase OafA/YrhL